MKIYIYPVDPIYQPSRQNFVWPPQNRENGYDFGVEQDFLEYLWRDGGPLLTKDIREADWVYLPVFWNRLYINMPDDDGNWGGSIKILPRIVDECLNKGYPTFTVTEADERILHPTIDWGNMVMMCSSRRAADPRTLDIPLLAGPHQLTHLPIGARQLFASFQGNLQTDGIRMRMREILHGVDGCLIEHANVSPQIYADVIANSYTVLAPRGQGAQSYRMYEAMALGSAPIYISDLDCRPFKNVINWSTCSFYLRDVEDIKKMIEYIAEMGVTALLRMDYEAQDCYWNKLKYRQWCKHALDELEAL